MKRRQPDRRAALVPARTPTPVPTGRPAGSSCPQRLSLQPRRARPCAVPANSTAGVTPISICGARVPNSTLSTEHRAAPGEDHIPLQLTQTGPALALAVLERSVIESTTPSTPVDWLRQTLAQLQEPAPLNQLRKLCGMRTAAVCSALTELSAKGEVVQNARGYQLKLPFPVSRPYRPPGNGKRETLPLLQRRIGALRGRNPVPTGARTQQKGRAVFQPKAVPAHTFCWSRKKAINLPTHFPGSGSRTSSAGHRVQKFQYSRFRVCPCQLASVQSPAMNSPRSVRFWEAFDAFNA